jgi:hypothetical protein
MQSHELLQRGATEVLYARARERGRRSIRWSALTGRSRCLLALEEILEGSMVAHGEQAETRQVPMCQIRGSEGRCSDFDRGFNPLQDHNRVRWLRVAAARQRGRSLPPVELVQVGDFYFVRDGHHRISVARALGYTTVEAAVQVWQVEGPPPWEESAPAITRRRAAQGVEQLHQKVRDGFHASVTFFAQIFALRSRMSGSIKQRG